MAKNFKPKAYASTSDAIADFEKAYKIMASVTRHIEGVNLAERDTGESSEGMYWAELMADMFDKKELLRAQLSRETERGYMIKA